MRKRGKCLWNCSIFCDSHSLPLLFFSLPLFFCAFSPFKHFSIKRLWTIFFFLPAVKRRSEGWGVEVRGVFWYIIPLPEKFCSVAWSLGQPLTHHLSRTNWETNSPATSPKPNNHPPSQPTPPDVFDYCHLTWRPSKDTDATHFATPAGGRRAAE